EIEKLGKHIFGIGVWAPSTSQVAVDYARNNLQVHTAVTIATNGQWSLAVAKSFQEQFQDKEGHILHSFIVNPDETDFRSLITRINQLKPDMLYAPLSDHQVPFWKQLHSSGYQGIRMTSDVLNEELLAEIGPLANGIYQTQVADPKHKKTQLMRDAYKRYFHKECTQTFLTALGYDGVHLAYQALQAAPLQNEEEITDALYKIHEYPGASGMTTISPEGSARKSASMFLVEDGKLVNNS
ncbi:MAG: ABC transporter substrate-binding protein, partial [Bdellovibrionales bacterium]|nr:ABC transporter substrate-binding protein [Bdellovibrionales bacterium]